MPDYDGLLNEIPRGRWGWYSLPPVEGEARGRDWQRATSLTDSLGPRHALDRWKRKVLLQGLIARPGLLPENPRVLEDGDTLASVVGAAEAAGGGHAARDHGIAVHSMLAELDSRDPARIRYQKELMSEDDTATAKAYYAARKAFGLTLARSPSGPAVERVVAAPLYGVAGTVDRWVELTRPLAAPSCVLPAGSVLVADIKTKKDASKSYSVGGFERQLAVYQSAVQMIGRDGWEPAPVSRPDWGMIFHLPQDGSNTCGVLFVDLQRGRDAMKAVMAVRAAVAEERQSRAYPACADEL